MRMRKGCALRDGKNGKGRKEEVRKEEIGR